MTHEEVIKRLISLGVEWDNNLLNTWKGKLWQKGIQTRFFHTFENHITQLYNILEETKRINDPVLFLAVYFHDIVYDPKLTDKQNVNFSADIFNRFFKGDNKIRIEVLKCIEATVNHNPTSDKAKEFCELDLWALTHETNFAKILHDEYLIFKEYQYVNFNLFKETRLKILKKFNSLQARIDLLEIYQPKIAVYAGSFNPFHKGHYNILQKAEQIFDKVIIARGSNPEKQNAEWPVPGLLYYYQFDYYDGLLTDYIKSLNYPVTLIRGLRDANDLQYEVTQLRYLQDLMPDVKVVNIICDKEYSHISSSALRSLDKIPNTDLKNYLL